MSAAGAGVVASSVAAAVSAAAATVSSTASSVAVPSAAHADLVQDHVLGPLDRVWGAAHDEVLVPGVGRGVPVNLAVYAARLVDALDGLPALADHQTDLAGGDRDVLSHLISASAVLLSAPTSSSVPSPAAAATAAASEASSSASPEAAAASSPAAEAHVPVIGLVEDVGDKALRYLHRLGGSGYAQRLLVRRLGGVLDDDDLSPGLLLQLLDHLAALANYKPHLVAGDHHLEEAPASPAPAAHSSSSSGPTSGLALGGDDALNGRLGVLDVGRQPGQRALALGQPVVVLLHLDLAAGLGLQAGDLLAAAADDQPHHLVGDHDDLRRGLLAARGSPGGRGGSSCGGGRGVAAHHSRLHHGSSRSLPGGQLRSVRVVDRCPL